MKTFKISIRELEKEIMEIEKVKERCKPDSLEIVALGKKLGIPTPYNTAIVNMVHQVEKQGKFLTEDELLSGVSKAMQN